MKKIIFLLPIILLSKECNTYKVDFIKENKQIYFKVKNKKRTSTTMERTNNKKIFKYHIGGFEYYNNNKKRKYILPNYQTIEILNKNKINIKYSTAGSELIIYAPEKEILENFIVKACRPYKYKKWKKVIREEAKRSIEKRKLNPNN